MKVFNRMDGPITVTKDGQSLAGGTWGEFESDPVLDAAVQRGYLSVAEEKKEEEETQPEESEPETPVRDNEDAAPTVSRRRRTQQKGK